MKPCFSLQNRRNYFALSSKRRQTRGEREARVTRDGFDAKRVNRKSDRNKATSFSPGKKTVAVKTALKRLGNRIDRIKKISATSVTLWRKTKFDLGYSGAILHEILYFVKDSFPNL